MGAKRFIAFIVFKAEGHISEQEIRDILPLDDLAGKGLDLIKITVLESSNEDETPINSWTEKN